MKNFKLILRSLLSNNACIEGGRKKKWYFAIIMFFLSVIIAIVPVFVKSIKTQGDDIFANVSYGTREATMRFSEYLKSDNDIVMVVEENTTNEDHHLKVVGFNSFEHKNAQDAVDFKFTYKDTMSNDELKEYQTANEKVSFIIFTQDNLYIHIVNPETKDAVANLGCVKAYKYMDVGYDLKSALVEKTGEPTASINETWDNWKVFFRKGYNFNRLTGLWQTCLLIGGIDIVITALMGFMVWVLTRGKNNPYRYFKIWECQKTAYWAAITPAILTCGLGFLLSRFANVLFPLLLGVRVMWLSMKSLRPDGTGYPIEQ